MPATKALFIGNSFTNRNDLPTMISRLAASSEPPRKFESQRVIANGMALKTHWKQGVAIEAIQRTAWDYVVLQEQSTLPLKNRQRMHESIRLFDAEIRRRKARTILYLTWSRAGELDRQDELTDAYVSIGRELGALIAPVGVAWQRWLRDKPTLTLHDRDKSHPNTAGSYLAACVFFATIFRASPVGIELDKSELSGIDSGSLRRLQKCAGKLCKTLLGRSDNKCMACFTCPTNSFRSISRAMAKGASARLRRLGITPTAVAWTSRAAACETCSMRVLRRGVSYCGTPFLQLIDRDPAVDGCGCPTRDKAKSADEHCPVDRHFRPAVMAGEKCSCRWCALPR